FCGLPRARSGAYLALVRATPTASKYPARGEHHLPARLPTDHFPTRFFTHFPTLAMTGRPTHGTLPPGMPRLVLKGISKAYPAVVANDQVDLAVQPGEIRAILGENGAGKSTLMKIIYGVTRPSAGQIFWEGEEVEVDNPAHARSLG